MPAQDKSKLVAIGIGSNQENPAGKLAWACRQFQADPFQLVATSSVYQSSPMGPQDQDDFLNAVVLIKTSLPPKELLIKLQKMEAEAGRQKTERWGPRSLDLDILLYDMCEICTDDLTIPHKGVNERNFVLVPLAELAQSYRLPQQEKVNLTSPLANLGTVEETKETEAAKINTRKSKDQNNKTRGYGDGQTRLCKTDISLTVYSQG
jgi:2-amino-4-hydroxy-6-hydroxymethyldihydropteridine diphosphokinase